MSLFKKFFLLSSIILIMLSGILTVVAIYNINQQTHTAIARQLHDTGSINASRLSDWFNVKKDGIASLSNSVTQFSDPQDISTILKAVTASSSLSLAYYGLETGDMYRATGLNTIANYDPRVRSWYKLALTSNEVVTTAPFANASTGDLVIGVAKKVVDNGQVIGVIGGSVNLQHLADTITKLNIPGDGFAFIVAKDGTIISHPQADLNTQPLSALESSMTIDMLNNESLVDELLEIEFNGEDYFASKSLLDGTDFYLVMAAKQDVLYAPVRNLMNTLIIVAIVLITVFLFLALTAIKAFLARLATVSDALQSAAEGNGDLTQRIPVISSDEIGQLAVNFNNFSDHLQGMLLKISESTQFLTTEAANLADSAANQIKSSQMQQSEITMVASAVSEMSSATIDIATNAEQTANISKNSVTISNQGQLVAENCEVSIKELSDEVNHASGVISELEQQSQQVNSIVETISGIAEQTNLLALNAAIEAARAGEQGRGFAVVADEVRVLSQRTHQSTEEISTMLSSFNSTILTAVNSMENCHKLASSSVDNAAETNTNFGKIKESIQEISSMSTNIATAAEEQSQVTGEVASNTDTIQNVALEFLDSAETGAKKATDLNQLSSNLDKLLKQFKLS